MLSDKVALVFGGSGGIGSSTVEALHSARALVYSTHSHSPPPAPSHPGPFPWWMPCDVRRDDEIASVIKTIQDRHGRLDVVIHCVSSPLTIRRFSHLSTTDFENDIDVILMGTIRILKHTLPLVSQSSSGVIVLLLTSMIENGAVPQLSPYVTAKFGVWGLFKTLVRELPASQLRLLALSPSFVETSLLKPFPAQLIEMEKEKSPDKKILQPSDISEILLSMIADPRRYPHGTHRVVTQRAEKHA